MKLVSTLILFLFVSIHLQASALEFEISSFVIANGSTEKKNGVCYIPNLTSQQRFIYDDIRKIHVQDTKKMRSILEKQVNDYKSILNNKKLESSGFADEIAGKYFKSKYNLAKNQTAFFHAVYYKILNKSQRKYLVACL